MKPLSPLALAGLAAASGLTLAACIVDFSNLSGGTRDGGATGGGGPGGGTSGPTGTASSASGMGGSDTSAASTTATSTTSASSGGTGGAPGPVCGSSVLDCSGCACPQGGCVVSPLATGTDADTASGIAASTDGVFWIDKAAGRIMGILAAGTAVKEMIKLPAPTSIVAAAGRLVITADDGVWTCKLPDCDASKAHRAGSIAVGSIRSAAYDGQLLYWADRGDENNTGNGKIWSCDLSTDCSSPASVADQVLHPQGLFLTVDSLLWIAQGNGQSNGSIHKSPRVGAGDTVLVAALVLPGGLAADDTNVYFTQGSTPATLQRCNHTQGYCMTPIDVAPAAGVLGMPVDVAIAGARVFWNESTKGILSSCPLPGCGATEKPRIHASGRTNIHHLAAGSSCLFWTDDVGGGSVAKMGR